VIFIHGVSRTQAVAALGADDARSDRPGQTKRSTNRQHAVADLHRITIAKLEIGQRRSRTDADNGQVVLAVAFDVLGDELTAVLERDLDPIGTIDHMEVRQHHSLGIDDETGAEAPLRNEIVLIKVRPFLIFEELAELFRNAREAIDTWPPPRLGRPFLL